MTLKYLARWPYGRFQDDNNILYKMKYDLTTGTWQDNIWCSINIILLCTSDVASTDFFLPWWRSFLGANSLGVTYFLGNRGSGSCRAVSLEKNGASITSNVAAKRPVRGWGGSRHVGQGVKRDWFLPPSQCKTQQCAKFSIHVWLSPTSYAQCCGDRKQQCSFGK